jgi:glutathione S-transferase
MPKLKLTYFDFHGGRGEPARLALSIGGIPFEDDRVAPSDWPARKPDTPFGALPVLEVDGQTLAQSNAINPTWASLRISTRPTRGRLRSATR